MRFTSLLVGVGDRRQDIGDRRQETGEMGMSEEVGVRIVPRLFCHNRPKILALCSSLSSKAGTFLDLKMLKPLYVNAFRFNQQALLRLDGIEEGVI
ncbi:MAG: hypothetical protein F6K17_25050 [Okeania sp. SIO3C4]|nr:hypothetical protein [Okeania sp. SIO3C4]